MRTDTVIHLLASHVDAYHRCKARGNTEWIGRHRSAVEQLCKDVLPSGSGIDNGTTIDPDDCTAAKIVLSTAYHHMNDGGMYDGWTEHRIIVRPSFSGIDLRVGGRDRNDIKDYLADVFQTVLTETVEQDWDGAAECYTYRRVTS